jgi:uncharacterized protein
MAPETGQRAPPVHHLTGARTGAETMTSSPSRSTAGWLAIVAVAALVVGLFAGPTLAGALRPVADGPTSPSAATDQPPEHTLSVSGSGKVTVVPDIATVDLGVSVERPTAKAARQAAAAAMTRVVDAIRRIGIDDKDIATVNVSLGPVYDYPSGSSPRVRGYQLDNTVTVTVRNLDQLGDVLDDGVTAGATTVQGISFDVADRAAAEAQAREAAVKDAKAKADTLANGLGIHISGVASVSEQVSTPIWYGRNFAAAGAVAQDASTPVMPGSTDVTIDVAVSFLID